MRAEPSTKATAIVDALELSSAVFTHKREEYRPQSGSWPFIEIPAGSIGCYLCPWYGSPGDLFQHTEKQHGAVGTVKRCPHGILHGEAFTRTDERGRRYCPDCTREQRKEWITDGASRQSTTREREKG